MMLTLSCSSDHTSTTSPFFSWRRTSSTFCSSERSCSP
ncbi:hypothetical protein BLA29_014601 [Euroglyphus maynei]|uniref:Uncharacterized protein n=1 Tax=Euroglyphus maynei TaxID=6958 RepID=A0A1Y3B520_EURMA|nr:hypothetical protein BLA29_014601 [Euroglyphus maynei]